MNKLEKLMNNKKCANCKFYTAEEYNPIGYDKCGNKPESEGICEELSRADGSIGIITDPDTRPVWVTSHFGCILFKKSDWFNGMGVGY